MEVCSPCNTSDHLSSSDSASSSLCMKDIKVCLAGLQNNEGFVSSSTGVSLSSCQRGTLDTNESEQESHHAVKGFSKSVTFPQTSGLKLSGHSEKVKQEDGEVSGIPVLNGENEFGHPCARSLSLPVFLDVVSAMKGSRERQGMPPKERSVTWAPDVYDPIPTSVLHVPSNKQYRYRKGGTKNKQKGGTKSSRNGKGKDKKWKNSGHSYILKPFNEESGVVVSGKKVMSDAESRPVEMVF